MTNNLHASANGHRTRNLFVDGDPDQFSPGPARRSATATRPRRGRGLVERLDPGAPSANAARFTLPTGRFARVTASAHASIRRADTRAAALLRRIGARPYAALSVFAALAAMLLALSWLGLALRDSAAAHHSAVRREAATAAALTGDEARIAALSAQLQQATVAAEQAQTAGEQAAAGGHNAPPSNPSNKH